MASSFSNSAQTFGLISSFVGEMFERWDCTLQPKNLEIQRDIYRMTFKEFPLLSLLPASQGLIYTPTAFVCDGVIYKPLRNKKGL